MSVTLLSAWPYHPSNHGTKPNTSPNRYLARSSPPMATTMAATSTTPRYPSMGSSKLNTPAVKTAMLSPSMTDIAMLIEDEDEFVKRIESECIQGEDAAKRSLFEEYVQNVQAQGHQAQPDVLATLLEQYNL
ncbi:hypothetical protein M422DRAFT_254419, partial [Sphaerobolus stellatus SS14]